MHFPDPPRAYQLSIILPFLTLTLAQDTTPQTIYSLSAFTMQKPCAQDCFTFSQLGCISDVLAGAIGCQNNYCSANFGAPDNCLLLPHRSPIRCRVFSYLLCQQVLHGWRLVDRCLERGQHLRKLLLV